MVLPKVSRCCWVLPLEGGGIAITIISLLACLASIAFCAVRLPEHRHQQNEDNIILLSMTMFCSLSAGSNAAALAGILLKRPSYLQMSVMTNVVFMVCILLVAAVTCLFSPALRPLLLPADRLLAAGSITLVVLLFLAACAYSIYYLTVVNSVYTEMKMRYGDSAIPYHV